MSAEIPFISSGGGPHDPFAGFGGPTPNASFPGGPPPPPHAAMPASDAASLFGGFNGSPISPALPAGRGAFGGGLAASEAPADLFGPAAGALDDPLGLNAANASAAGQFGQATQAGGGLTYEEASRNWTLDQATNMFYDSAQGLYFSADETGYSWHAYTWHEGVWSWSAGWSIKTLTDPSQVTGRMPVLRSTRSPRRLSPLPYPFLKVRYFSRRSRCSTREQSVRRSSLKATGTS